MWDHFFPLLFPKDSESLKILDIRFWEVGAKRLLNGTSKVTRQTDTHTDTHTETHMDKSTYRKHRPRGPMLWKYFREAKLVTGFQSHWWLMGIFPGNLTTPYIYMANMLDYTTLYHSHVRNLYVNIVMFSWGLHILTIQVVDLFTFYLPTCLKQFWY